MLANPDTPQRSQSCCRSSAGSRCRHSTSVSNQSYSSESMMQSAVSAMRYLVPPTSDASTSHGSQARSGSCPGRMGCRHDRSLSRGRATAGGSVYDPAVNQHFGERLSREASRNRASGAGHVPDRNEIRERRRRQVAEARLRFFGSSTQIPMGLSRSQPSVVDVYGSGNYPSLQLVLGGLIFFCFYVAMQWHGLNTEP